MKLIKDNLKIHPFTPWSLGTSSALEGQLKLEANPQCQMGQKWTPRRLR